MRFVILIFLFYICQLSIAQNTNIINITIETELGEFQVELYLENAPITVKNFLAYVDSGYYSYGSFMRTVKDDNQPNNMVKIDVIQADTHPWYSEALSPIEHESTIMTGISHKNGTLSMARGEPGTASSSFFICIGDQPQLDFGGKRNSDGAGFSAFGKVISGMNVAKKIQQSSAKEQALMPPIRILKISREL